MSFHVQTCRCSHAEADHVRGRTAFPHPQQNGQCLVPGCGCRKFRDVNEQEKAA